MFLYENRSEVGDDLVRDGGGLEELVTISEHGEDSHEFRQHSDLLCVLHLLLQQPDDHLEEVDVKLGYNMPLYLPCRSLRLLSLARSVCPTTPSLFASIVISASPTVVLLPRRMDGRVDI